MYDKFESAYQATIGIDFLSKTVHVDGDTVRLQLWDTAGQERFRSLIPAYLRDSAVAVCVYDVTDRRSFDATRHWVDEVRAERGSDVVVALVGNKIDLVDGRVVSSAEGEAHAASLKALFAETSALEGTGVQALFTRVVRAVIEAEGGGGDEGAGDGADGGKGGGGAGGGGRGGDANVISGSSLAAEPAKTAASTCC